MAILERYRQYKHEDVYMINLDGFPGQHAELLYEVDTPLTVELDKRGGYMKAWIGSDADMGELMLYRKKLLCAARAIDEMDRAAGGDDTDAVEKAFRALYKKKAAPAIALAAI